MAKRPDPQRMPPADEVLRQALKRSFGHDAFREGQEPVIRALLAGKSALAVFPTGGGKSLCYQLPALLIEGITLVVSPLIALMEDQVESLLARGIAAARLDSTLDVAELARIYAGLDAGEIKLLYVAPERFANDGFRKRLKHWRIGLAAIDEAHCISEWGHNFRPDYLKLAKLFRNLKIPRVLALTATATPDVARDIRKGFRIAREDHVQLSFHRPNLDLRVTGVTARERKKVLLQKLADAEGAVVVYVTRQETAEEVATFLGREGLSARAYHAGLPDDFRSDAQHSFMKGDTRIIVATIAFGMGIDKSDIRQVIHYNLPKSLENYVQEIGRAGRDGEAALCTLLACGDDLTVLENFIHADTPAPRALENAIDRVLRLGTEFDVSPYDLSATCDVRQNVIDTLLTYLEISGIIEGKGKFYGTYRIKPLRSIKHIVAGMSVSERRFSEKLFASAKPGRVWFTIDPREAAEVLGTTRQKVVATLGDWEAAGDIALAKSRIRVAYRLKRPPESIRRLAEEMGEAFSRRAAADLRRIDDVVKLAAHQGCLTDYVTRHFGESLESPCGHCDRCRGEPPVDIARHALPPPDDEEWRRVRELARERHAALLTDRQLARFLCGMTSPATLREKLTRHDAFGMWNDRSFDEVMELAAAAIR